MRARRRTGRAWVAAYSVRVVLGMGLLIIMKLDSRLDSHGYYTTRAPFGQGENRLKYSGLVIPANHLIMLIVIISIRLLLVFVLLLTGYSAMTQAPPSSPL